MYNEKLEQLIDAALTDGELTEKEKQILFKKAQAMDIDLDEFEMVLDARLVKLKKAEEENAKSSAPKSNKFGDIKKCPSCGAIVQSYSGKCKDCGYEFEYIEANSSSKRLAELIQETSDKMRNRKDGFWDSLEEDNKIDEEIGRVIRTFPVPTTKSDLLEFMSMCSSNMGNGLSPTEEQGGYKAKLKECIVKAKVLFPNDKEIAVAIDLCNDMLNKRRKFIIMIPLIFFSVFMLLVILLAVFGD